jgi:hypothetical protein
VLAYAQTAPLVDWPFRIQRLDPALDQIIAADAKLEVLVEHFGPTRPTLFTNGLRPVHFRCSSKRAFAKPS